MTETSAAPRPSPSRIRNHLHALITAERYRSGDRLPTERVLSEELQAPRTAVRDALAMLERDGVVVRRAGSGTYVAEAPTHAASMLPASSSPRDIMEARLALEPALARIAALTATNVDLERISGIERSMVAAESVNDFQRHGYDLHSAIAEATHNQILIAMYALVSRASDQAEWGELKSRSLNAANWQAYMQEHALLVSSICRRNAVQAEEAAARHVRTVRRDMLGE